MRIEISGELSRRLSVAPLRVLMTISGLTLVRGVLVLFARYCLGMRSRVTASLAGSLLTVNSTSSIFGRVYRQRTTVSPLGEIAAVRLENRRRYLHLTIGFGALVVGIWIGLQIFVDGLRAGFPYLTLVGAGVIAAGVLIDVLLYVFVPRGPGKTRLLLAAGPWQLRLSGIDPQEGKRFLDAAQASWESAAARGG